MTTIELTLAIAVLLVTPGPTNTLLAIAGAERGVPGALRLVPAELAGYLATVAPLAILGGTLVDAVPLMRPILTLVAALWVGWLALGFWRMASSQATREEGASTAVTASTVFVTTLLNPKALVFGLVLLPAGPSLPGAFALFAAQIVIVAVLWASVGQMLRQTDRSQAGLPGWLLRLAAIWLAVVAVLLIARLSGA